MTLGFDCSLLGKARSRCPTDVSNAYANGLKSFLQLTEPEIKIVSKSLAGSRLSSSITDEPALRIGHGFDIHRLIEGTKLIIG